MNSGGCWLQGAGRVEKGRCLLVKVLMFLIDARKRIAA